MDRGRHRRGKAWEEESYDGRGMGWIRHRRGKAWEGRGIGEDE